MELDFLNLFSVLLAAWLAGWAATRLGFPAVLGELVVGVLLGPPLLGLLHGSEALAVLAELGVLLMMLYIGMEIDPRELTRASWAGVLAAVGGFFVPFSLGYVVVVWFGASSTVGLIAGISAGVTSLAVNSRILLDLSILDTRISHVMMAGALVADILSLLVFSVVLGIVDIGTLAVGDMLLVALKAGVFFAVTILIGMRVFPYIGRLLTSSGLTGRTFHFTLVLIIAVLFGELAEIAGLHAILGAFIAGLFLRENVLGLTLSRDLREAVQDTSLGLLTPIFFVTAGFSVSFGVFQEQAGLLALVVFIAIVGKTLGTALFYLPSKNGWRESLVIGIGMNGRGGVDIILIGISLEMGIIGQDIFSILVFMALLTTSIVPLALKSGIGWLSRRGELARPGSEKEGTVIIGAGPLARALARALTGQGPVTLVDTNEHHCMVGKSEGLHVVHGSALQEQVLIEAEVPRVDSLVAMTANAEVNAIVAKMARDVFHVSGLHILPGVSSVTEQEAVRKHLGAGALFAGPVDLEEWDHWISHGKTVQTVVPVNESVPAAEFISRLQEESPSIALAVRRGGETLVFHDGVDLGTEDSVVILRVAEGQAVQQDRFDRIVLEAPILDLAKINSAEDFFDLAASALSERLDVNKESLSRLFLQGETWSSTVVAPGLAIPHIFLTGKHEFQLLIARSIDGIHFPNQDEPVNMIFVLVSTQEHRNFHLRALSAIAQIAQDEMFEEGWKSATGPESLRNLILGADRRRYPDSDTL